jgi:hypothetical protein
MITKNDQFEQKPTQTHTGTSIFKKEKKTNNSGETRIRNM